MDAVFPGNLHLQPDGGKMPGARVCRGGSGAAADQDGGGSVSLRDEEGPGAQGHDGASHGQLPDHASARRLCGPAGRLGECGGS